MVMFNSIWWRVVVLLIEMLQFVGRDWSRCLLKKRDVCERLMVNPGAFGDVEIWYFLVTVMAY